MRLLHGPASEVLARLEGGDALGLRQLVGERLRSAWRVLDADRVHLRALALVAHRAGAWSGRPALRTWLATQVDAAIDEVRREPALTGSAADLAAPLGLDPTRAAAVRQALDGRGQDERRAFVRLLLEGEDLDRIAADEGVSGSAVGRRARAALDAVLAAAAEGEVA